MSTPQNFPLLEIVQLREAALRMLKVQVVGVLISQQLWQTPVPLEHRDIQPSPGLQTTTLSQRTFTLLASTPKSFLSLAPQPTLALETRLALWAPA